MKEVKLSMDEASRVIKKLAQELLKRLNERYELFPVITQLAANFTANVLHFTSEREKLHAH